MLRPFSIFVVVLLTTASLCGMASGVRFLSFDASLLLGVDAYSIERLENINYALARASLTSMASHADAICLQGYWLPYQVQQLNATLSPYLPYSYMTPPVSGTCFCTTANLAPLLGCLQTQNCSAQTGNAQLLCAFGCLNAYLPTMNSVCANCLTAGLGGIVSQTTSLNTVIGGCLAAAALNASGDDCVPYGGYSGNVLFSRSPFQSVSAVSLALPVTPRPLHSDAILATTSFSGLGDVNLVCTQLQPSGPPVTNATVLQLFAQINAAQLEILRQAIDAWNGKTGIQQVVVMGNFKQSPNISSTGVQPVFPELYSVWNSLGYSEYINQCTACASNRLLVDPFLNDTMSSHIFVRGFTANPNVESVVGQIALNTTTTILDITTSTTPHAEVVHFSANYAVQLDINVASASSSSASTVSGVAGHLLRSLLLA